MRQVKVNDEPSERIFLVVFDIVRIYLKVAPDGVSEPGLVRISDAIGDTGLAGISDGVSDSGLAGII